MKKSIFSVTNIARVTLMIPILILVSPSYFVAKTLDENLLQYFMSSTIEDITLERLQKDTYLEKTFQLFGEGISNFYSKSEAYRYGYSYARSPYIETPFGFDIALDLSGKANSLTRDIKLSLNDGSEKITTDTLNGRTSDLYMLDIRLPKGDLLIGCTATRYTLPTYDDNNIIVQMTDSQNIDYDEYRPLLSYNFMNVVSLFSDISPEYGITNFSTQFNLLPFFRKKSAQKNGTSDLAGNSVKLGLSYFSVTSRKWIKPGIRLEYSKNLGFMKMNFDGSAEYDFGISKGALNYLGKSIGKIGFTVADIYFLDGTVNYFQQILQGGLRPVTGYCIETGARTMAILPFWLELRFKYAINEYNQIVTMPFLLDAQTYGFALGFGVTFK